MRYDADCLSVDDAAEQTGKKTLNEEKLPILLAFRGEKRARYKPATSGEKRNLEMSQIEQTSRDKSRKKDECDLVLPR